MASAHNNGGGGGGGDAATGGGRSETDHVTALELQSNRRLLYFSDGVMEELSTDSDDSDDAEPSDVPDKAQLEVGLSLLMHLFSHFLHANDDESFEFSLNSFYIVFFCVYLFSANCHWCHAYVTRPVEWEIIYWPASTTLAAAWPPFWALRTPNMSAN